MKHFVRRENFMSVSAGPDVSISIARKFKYSVSPPRVHSQQRCCCKAQRLDMKSVVVTIIQTGLIARFAERYLKAGSVQSNPNLSCLKHNDINRFIYETYMTYEFNADLDTVATSQTSDPSSSGVLKGVCTIFVCV